MRVVTVVGGTLFRVAAEQLGDATQWIRIAQANGLSDPMLSGVVTLRIPASDTQAGGGIAVQ
jgi:L-ascorbate metabolism protein UlaG (beta-lactamase superfamily)